ncbi:MAG: TonB-dependent receptor [Pseudomonadota bacterium]
MLRAKFFALAAAVWCANMAFAQTSEPPADDKLEEVLVTGEKITRSQQDTQTSVAIFDEVELERQDILDVKDVIDRTANLATTEGSRFTIRGIDSLNVSGAGLADLATIYVDGSPLPRDATLAGPLDVWDLQQVEIFRGPQSTLQGRNALAGAIILNTVDPGYEWSGRARAIFGTKDGSRRLSGAFGGPIVEDQFAFRLSAESSVGEGFITNVTRNDFPDERETVTLRGKLLWEPSQIDDLRVLLSYTYDDREFGDSLFSLEVPDAREQRLMFANRDTRDEVELSIGVLTIDYDFSERFSLTSITAVNDTARIFEGDGDRTAVDTEFSVSDSDTTTTTQELRFAYDGDRLKAVFGGYFANIDTPNRIADAVLNLDVIEDLGLVNQLVTILSVDLATAQALSAFYTNPVTIRAVSDNPVEIDSMALFADFSYALSDRFTLYGGFRLDQEEQVITTGNEIIADRNSLPDPVAIGNPFGPLVSLINDFLVAEAERATSEPVTTQSPSFDAFLPKLGVGWDFADNQSVSLTAQRGYRSGGVGVNPARAASFNFDQEFIWNYELAYRSQWLDRALTVNANVFYIDWEDQQVSVQLTGNVFDRETQNAGSSRIYGFEVESRYKLDRNTELYGSIGFADTRFNDFFVNVDGLVLDLAGNEFFFAPKRTVALGYTRRTDDGFILNLNANYNSSSFPRADRPQTERAIDRRVLVNLRAGWENERYGIYVTGRNLLDEDNILTLTPFDPLLTSNEPEFARASAPRTFALQLEARF